jgi:hypothetical protein
LRTSDGSITVQPYAFARHLPDTQQTSEAHNVCAVFPQHRTHLGRVADFRWNRSRFADGINSSGDIIGGGVLVNQTADGVSLDTLWTELHELLELWKRSPILNYAAFEFPNGSRSRSRTPKYSKSFF